AAVVPRAAAGRIPKHGGGTAAHHHVDLVEGVGVEGKLEVAHVGDDGVEVADKAAAIVNQPIGADLRIARGDVDRNRRVVDHQAAGDLDQVVDSGAGSRTGVVQIEREHRAAFAGKSVTRAERAEGIGAAGHQVAGDVHRPAVGAVAGDGGARHVGQQAATV